MSSFIHQALRSWRTDVNLPYLSSIMILNKDIPLFNTVANDYEWTLAVTENRNCREVEPIVHRFINENNLSLNQKYRETSFHIMISVLEQYGELEGIKRLCASYAKYFYKIGQYGRARWYFMHAEYNTKNTMYIITSFVPPLARWIVRKYVVFG